jgi:hypothetical protein
MERRTARSGIVRFTVTIIIAACFRAGGFAAQEDRAHLIEPAEMASVAEDGLLLGNGDLSVSAFRSADCIIWRFGKGDVWDRRIDRSDDPRPAHIDEVARGIRDEGWKCPPYGGPVEATRGTKDPARMRDICQAVPPSYRQRPYPCPKPVGELALHLPADAPGLRIRQRLSIEEARLEIEASWATGAVLRVACCVPPEPNVLLLRWKIEGWTEATRTGNNVPPVRFSLYRWADPTIADFADRFFAECRHDGFRTCASPKATPLPPPSLRADGPARWIEQAFPPDPTFPSGFRCLVAPMAPGTSVEPVAMAPAGEARLHILPPLEAREGILAVAVATTGDEGGDAAALRRILEAGRDLPSAAPVWEESNRAAARRFWSRSSVRISDPLIEGLWYETFHARRATTRPGKFPPGLFLPSTVRDYSHWHGDYHLNYNLQEPFWGDLTANQVELADAYLDALGPLLEVGRKIARDHYGVRGAFIQLSGYPARMEEDPLGCVPMGRMAYMTGWAVNQLWWRYRHTLDRDWLRSAGYPAIRDCALFYTDFLKPGADGLYHIFPSNQGEDGFSGDPKDFTDRAQVMTHLRYCLRAAIGAAEALETDQELRSAWRDRLEKCAGDEGRPPARLEGIERECSERNPPEFGTGRTYRPQPASSEGNPWPAKGDGAWTWYFGQYPWMTIRMIRQAEFIADRDFPAFRGLIERWRHPNGLVWGMAVGNYGRAGAWTESLGVAAALQEMLLGSWDGALRIFPAWPRGLDGSFDSFRAEGAFLVGASCSKGEVTRLEVRSEKGGPCRLYPPWAGGIRATDADGGAVEIKSDPWGRASFETVPGGTYRIGVK